MRTLNELQGSYHDRKRIIEEMFLAYYVSEPDPTTVLTGIFKNKNKRGKMIRKEEEE
jgi:hypothetical protein